MAEQTFIEEVPFDVADWGFLPLAPIFTDEASFQELMAEPFTEEYLAAVEAAKRDEAARLAPGGE